MDKPKVCGNCKHRSSHFKIADTTHLCCQNPEKDFDHPFDSVREWYNRYDCFEPKEDVKENNNVK